MVLGGEWGGWRVVGRRVGNWVVCVSGGMGGGEDGWGGGGGGCGDVEIGVVREVRAWWGVGGGVMWALWFLLLLDKTKGNVMY